MRMARNLVIVLAFACAVAPAAHASTTNDLRGTWNCCGSGGAANQTWNITSMDLSSGKFSGRGAGGSYTFPITGTANGDSVELTTGPYDQLQSYSATFTGTIAAGTTQMSGSWKSNSNQTGTWTATKSAAPVITAPLSGATLGGKPKQKVGPRVGIVISCGIDACLGEVDGVLTVFPAGRPGQSRASAKPRRYKLKRARVLVPANSRKTVRLKLGKRLRTARRNLRRGGRARVGFRVKLTDAAGRVRRLKRTVKLTR